MVELNKRGFANIDFDLLSRKGTFLENGRVTSVPDARRKLNQTGRSRLTKPSGYSCHVRDRETGYRVTAILKASNQMIDLPMGSIPAGANGAARFMAIQRIIGFRNKPRIYLNFESMLQILECKNRRIKNFC